MTATETLRALSDLDATIKVVDGDLDVDAPSALPPALISGLRQHKEEIVCLIRPFEVAPDADGWDWFKHIGRADLRYLTTPRQHQHPCPWCHRLGEHSEACEDLHDGWSTPMPFGKHRGTPVRRLPRSYLRWLQLQEAAPELKDEIERALQ